MTTATIVIPASGRGGPDALARLTGADGMPSLVRTAVEAARIIPGVANVVVATDAPGIVNAASGLATCWYQPTDDAWCGVVRAARALNQMPPAYSAAVDAVVIWEPEEASVTADDVALVIESAALFYRESSQCVVCVTAPAINRDTDPARRAVLVRQTAEGTLDFWPYASPGPKLRALSLYGFTPAGLRRAAAATPTVDAIAAAAEQLAWTEAGMELVEIRLTGPRPVVRTPGDMRRWLNRRNGGTMR